MMNDPTMLWNLILSIAAGAFLWWIRGVSQQINDVKRRIADTREEIAKTYSTKQETEENIKQILTRFDKLEAKMDTFIERMLAR